MRRVGVGYRRQLASWINQHPEAIQCLEVIADHFFDDPSKLAALNEHYPILMHGLGISLGTPGDLDQTYLERFANVCRLADPVWISEHIAFTRSSEVDLGHLNPIPYTEKTLDYFCEHVKELSDKCQKPVLLENITSHIKMQGTISEPDFINRVCEQTGCGLLLDVTNLYVNSKNHNTDMKMWLRQINPAYIKQLHIVGYSSRNGVLYDSHSQNIQAELFEVAQEVIRYSDVEWIIIERDNNFPTPEQLEKELIMMSEIHEQH